MRPSDLAIKRARLRLTDLLGEKKVLADSDLLEKYATDESGAAACMPDLVVRVTSTDDIANVFRIATEERVPVTPRGLGSGKSGGALPVYGGIVLSLERMNRVQEINRDDMLVVAEAGVITKDLMDAVEEEGLFYPPDPNSLEVSSIGGNVACNAGGPRAVKYGVTRNYILGLKVVLPNGEVLEVGKRTIKHVTGYDLTGLIVGSEGTLAVVTEVICKLIPKPASVQTALVSFPNLEQAGNAITGMLSAGIVPRTLELLDHNALDAVRKKSPGRFPENAEALLILETDERSEERAFADLEEAASTCLDRGALDVLVAQDEAQRQKIWEPRRVLSTTLTESTPCKIAQDIAVPRSLIPRILREVTQIADNHQIRVATYGHAGDGNLHVNVLFDEETRERAKQVEREVLEATVSVGGTISGEHGIGLLKKGYIELEQTGPMIDLQRKLKAAIDPNGILNPGKIFPSRGVRE